jgi:7-keto-8-aminopelargonate synthetase-like enzyme
MGNIFFDQLYSAMHSSIELGIMHLTTDDLGFNGDSVSIDGRSYLNFTLCDYLALSQDNRLKNGAIYAIEKYGVYTAVSKSYIKLNIYAEAENSLAKIFQKPTILFPRTTLAHIGVLPVIVDSSDAVILDQQVHTSVKLASDLLKGSGIHIETIKHSRLDILEDRIKELQVKYKKIWYLVDSVYSMYGDVLPCDGLVVLLNKYNNLRVYVDDAHGMSWIGENGKGLLLNNIPYHPNIIHVSSLGKAFGAGGGVVVCYDDQIRDRLVTCAPPLLFTSPVPPATLGAIVESSKIHLSDEITIRQNELKKRIDLFYRISKEFNLPVISDPSTPIVFIATGKPDMCREICSNVMDQGFYINASHFPAVPLNNSGIRIVISLYHSEEDIIALVNVLKHEFEKSLKKRNLLIFDIIKQYKVAHEYI